VNRQIVVSYEELRQISAIVQRLAVGHPGRRSRGVLFELDDEGLSIVASDGIRLVVHKVTDLGVEWPDWHVLMRPDTNDVKAEVDVNLLRATLKGTKATACILRIEQNNLKLEMGGIKIDIPATTAGKTAIGVNPRLLFQGLPESGSVTLAVRDAGSALVVKAGEYAYLLMPVLVNLEEDE
jgi:hypothetical protein